MDLALVLLVLASVAGLTGLAWASGPAVPAGGLGACGVPAERADALLRQVLDSEAYQRLVRCGYLDVSSPTIAGRSYRIPYGPGRVEVREQGCLIARLCVVPAVALPAADVVLTHKLLIEGDEARYLRVANHFPAGGARRIGGWPP